MTKQIVIFNAEQCFEWQKMSSNQTEKTDREKKWLKGTKSIMSRIQFIKFYYIIFISGLNLW